MSRHNAPTEAEILEGRIKIKEQWLTAEFPDRHERRVAAEQAIYREIAQYERATAQATRAHQRGRFFNVPV